MIFRPNTSSLLKLFVIACSTCCITVYGMANEERLNPDEYRRINDWLIPEPATNNEQMDQNTTLFTAIMATSEEETALLLENGANPNERSSHDYNMTDLAMYKGNQTIIDILKYYGGKGTPNATRLHYAASFNDCTLAKDLLDNGFYVDPRRQGAITPLHEAAYWGNIEMAHLLLEHGADANAKNDFSKTPLHDALSQSHWAIAELLIRYHADLNIIGNDKKALWQVIIEHCARFQNSLENNDPITALLKAVATHKVSPESNITILHCAAFNLNEPLVHLLLKNGAPVNVRNFLGKTPLHDACTPKELQCITQAPTQDILDRQQRIVSILLNGNADPNILDNQNNTPLTISIIQNSISLIKPLLAKNTNSNIPIEGYATLLHYCAAKNRPEIAQELLDHGALVNVQDSNRNTPLHIACQNGFEAIATSLLNHNARIDLKDKWGKTALDIDDKEKRIIRKNPKLQILTLAMACHEGLGAQSPAKALNVYDLQCIHSFLKQIQ